MISKKTAKKLIRKQMRRDALRDNELMRLEDYLDDETLFEQLKHYRKGVKSKDPVVAEVSTWNYHYRLDRLYPIVAMDKLARVEYDAKFRATLLARLSGHPVETVDRIAEQLLASLADVNPTYWRK